MSEGWRDQDFIIDVAPGSADPERSAYMAGQRCAERGGSRDENSNDAANIRAVWDWGYTSGEWAKSRI